MALWRWSFMLVIALGGCANAITDRMDDFFQSLNEPLPPSAPPAGFDMARQPGYAPAYPPFNPRDGSIMTDMKSTSQ